MFLQRTYCVSFLAMLLLPLYATAQQSYAVEEQQRWLQQQQQKVISWTELRDDQVVKQQLDYSCGAAATATVLNSYYGIRALEVDILRRYFFDPNRGISFSGLAQIFRDYELTPFAVALDYPTLTKLRVPAIVYLRVRGEGHFSVVRAVTAQGVWLADSAWGNTRLSQTQFRKMWETRDDPEKPGRALIALPKDQTETNVANIFFGSDNLVWPFYPVDSRLLERNHLNWSLVNIL